MILLIQNDHRVPPGLITELLHETATPFREARLFESPELPDPRTLSGIILLGGYMGVHELDRHPHLAALPRFVEQTLAAQVPLLGICLGGQLLAAVLGAEVSASARGERGLQPITLSAAGVHDPLFRDLPQAFSTFQWHNDSFAIPGGAIHLAASAVCPGQAFRCGNAYGLQFHPEVTAAIVADWCQTSGVDPSSIDTFLEQEATHRAMARTLLRNFLSLTG